MLHHPFFTCHTTHVTFNFNIAAVKLWTFLWGLSHALNLTITIFYSYMRQMWSQKEIWALVIASSLSENHISLFSPKKKNNNSNIFDFRGQTFAFCKKTQKREKHCQHISLKWSNNKQMNVSKPQVFLRFSLPSAFWDWLTWRHVGRHVWAWLVASD